MIFTKFYLQKISLFLFCLVMAAALIACKKKLADASYTGEYTCTSYTIDDEDYASLMTYTGTRAFLSMEGAQGNLIIEGKDPYPVILYDNGICKIREEDGTWEERGGDICLYIESAGSDLALTFEK